MILSELLRRPVHDSTGAALGKVLDVRFVIDGAPGPLLAEARLAGLIVSPHSGTAFLGYERTDANAPWLIASLLGWRHRGTFLAAWADVHRIDDHSITLRPAYHRYSAHLPTAHRGVDV